MKKVLLKVYSFILTIMLVLGIMPTGAYISYAASSSVDTQATDDGIQYFPVTLYNYDTKAINKATEEAEKKDTKQGIKFNKGDGTQWNAWTGTGGGAYTGLAKSKFENGTIAFNVPQGGIFTSSNTGKKSYIGVQLPFTKDSDGYYTFDSSVKDAYFENTPGDNLTLLTSSRTFNKVSSTDGKKTGFFPFNNASSTKDSDPVYHFGMAMTTNFYTTSDGKVNGKDMTFEFTGDDDVWVFVDGNLVLDLGGIHNAVSGSVNFATGKITCDKTDAGKVPGTTGGSTMGGNLYTDSVLGAKESFLGSDKPHTLQVFYLERGEGASNCKIKFNMPQNDKLEISKSLDSDTLNSTNNKDIIKKGYTFTVKKDNAVFAKKSYILYDSNNSPIGDYNTNDNGELVLKAGQTARFDNFENGTYTVTETEDSSLYTSSWQHGTSAGLSNGNEYKISRADNGTVYRFVCTNTIKPQLVNDAVVIDFGKTLTIDVLKNDKLYGKTGELSIKSSSLTEGKAVVADNKVKYTPTKFMDKVDTAIYSYGKYGSAKVSVIPASNIYYEDDFSDGTTDEKGNPNTVIKYGEGWNAIGKNNVEGIEGDGTLGYDSAYDKINSQLVYSGGTIHYVPKSNNIVKADFTFTGQGIDIYSYASGDTGRFMFRLYDENNKLLSSKSINTKYNSGGAYQLPVATFMGDKSKTYRVEIIVPRNNAFYLDAVRIYNSVNVDKDKIDIDNEADAKFVSIREQSLLSNKADLFTVDGNVFIDAYLKNNAKVVAIPDKMDEYTTYGRKTEVVIAPGDRITLTLQKAAKAYSKVQLGARIDAAVPTQRTEITIPENLTNEVLVNNKDIGVKSSTDMYYTVDVVNGKLVITNNTNKLLALTKLKLLK